MLKHFVDRCALSFFNFVFIFSTCNYRSMSHQGSVFRDSYGFVCLCSLLGHGSQGLYYPLDACRWNESVGWWEALTLVSQLYRLVLQGTSKVLAAGPPRRSWWCSGPQPTWSSNGECRRGWSHFKSVGQCPANGMVAPRCLRVLLFHCFATDLPRSFMIVQYLLLGIARWI